MAYFSLDFVPMITPPRGLQRTTISGKATSFFTDRKGLRWFGVASLAAALDTSEDFIVSTIHEVYGPWLHDAFCVTPHKKTRLFIAEPCFAYLVYTQPRLAHLRRHMEQAVYPTLKWRWKTNCQ